MEPEEVTLQLLREMTDDFSRERQVGDGSFGVVYRGVTHAGEDVAVKKLKPNSYNTDAGSKQFKNEIYNLAMLKHQNIVQILGYCYETEKKSTVFNGKIVLTEETHRAICLEYLHKGSLCEHLSDEFGGLDWDTRFKIIKGICEGLKYFLHDLEVPLCHFDLKPENILLDKDMAPKIADFGLSMIFGKEQKRTTPYPLGTLGYQPPEYIDEGDVTNKFDIFSLGVIMIMIVSGPKGYHKCGYMSSDEFSNQVRMAEFSNQVQKNWRHRLQETINGSLLEMYCRQVDTCIQIALKCVDKDWQRRPDIVMITEMLNEIETYNCTLPQNGCHRNISTTTRYNNKRKRESEVITGQHHNIKLMKHPNCSELEFADAQETSSYGVKELIIGRDDEKEKIVTALLKIISETIAILPIHGIGGIGKTTLARLIYNDPKFKSYSQVWVHVSQRFDLIKIRDSIISQLSREESCDNERQMVENCLTKLLSNKKILVVLDDLWEDNQFKLDELKAMLNNKYSNIIVLVTTRSEDVADRICTNLQPHKILPLTDDMCWDIIKQRSGFHVRDDNEQLISIGLEIAQKCGGVALAAQSLGFTLQSMNIDQWMKVKDSDIWNLPNDHVLASLQLSYSYMAPCLKTCFTYCAIFPKGHKMVKDDLIYQWISMDFIKPTKLLSSMHLCDKYIGQLLGLSFFQHYSLSPKTVAAYNEDVIVFTMHDLVHDLATSVLLDEILCASKQGNTGESGIHFELLDDFTESLQAFTQYHTNIRGLRFLESDKIASIRVCGEIGNDDDDDDDDVFSSVQDLQVLDLSECSIKKLPNSIGNLKMLRYLNAPRVQHWVSPYSVMKLSKLIYLSLRGSSKILALPDSIGEMEGLMYLDLSGCSRIKKLPVSFGKLTKLVHLDFSNCDEVTYVSESLKSLTNLEYLDLSHCRHIGDLSENLGCLLKLRNLNISDSSYVRSDRRDYSANAEVLFNLTKLECLNLSSHIYPACTTFKNLPKALNRFPNLKYLTLEGLDLQTEHWPIRREGPIAFGNLKNLVHLDLSSCSGVHGVLDNLGSLTKLQHLNLSKSSCFDDCTELHHSRMLEAMGNLTKLRYLDLSYCSKHNKQVFLDFLECIGNLPNLEHLELRGNQSLKSLPDSFRGLRKLHTVDLSNCWDLQVLPSFLSEMDRLKFILLNGCAKKLDMSKHSQLNKIVLDLPNFVVHSDSHDSESNLFLINDVNRYDLVISRLENVRSVQEACSIKLAGKDRMGKLELNWTKDVERYVEDMEVLGALVPPTALRMLKIVGYNSVRFPQWFVGSIAFHLPNLVQISMSDFSKCNSLPPLGQLPNLEDLVLEQMNGISEINWDLCGSRWAFPRLKSFRLSEMESLKVWYTTYPGGMDGMSQFMFPNLSDLNITDCPNLRMKPCPHRVSEKWIINGRSDDLISSWGEGEGEEASQISVTYSASVPVPALVIKGCKVPMHQWRLLHHLPCLTTLTIIDCSDLSISPEITRALSSLREMIFETDDPYRESKLPADKLELPIWLGQLASLEDLTVRCREVKAPQDLTVRLCSLYLDGIESMTTLQPWVGTLTSLQRLQICGCGKLNDLLESIGCLSSLKDLFIDCDGITSLPESIGCLTSLEDLEIISGNMTSLPESIGCLTSLDTLCIRECHRITSLPESIQQLTNLERLEIYACEELEEWCETEENKAKLAHIKVKDICNPLTMS